MLSNPEVHENARQFDSLRKGPYMITQRSIDMRRHSMKAIVIVLLAATVLAAQTGAKEAPLGGIQLLPGYELKQSAAVDANAWSIVKRGGLEISFEAGPNEGPWATSKDQAKYAWYRVQTINGKQVRFALVKKGVKTQFEPNNTRGLAPGYVLLVTYMLGGEDSGHTANFSAKIADATELGDALLM